MPKTAHHDLVKIIHQLIQLIVSTPNDDFPKTGQKILKEDKTLSIDEILEARFIQNSMNAFQFAAITTSQDYILWLIDKVQNHYTKKLAKSKLKTEIKQARDEFFYGLFKLGLVDWHIASFLFARAEKLGYAFFRLIEDKLHFLEKKEKTIFLNQIMQPKGTTFEGYYRYQANQRVKRSYRRTREQQLLKQLSTLMFFQLPAEAKCIEVECMHVRMQGRSYLFVAANPAIAGQYLNQLVMNNQDLERKLKTSYTVKGDKEGNRRVERYAYKMQKMVFGLDEYQVEDEIDNAHFQELAALLRADQPSDFQFLNELPNSLDEQNYTRPCYLLIKKSLFYYENGKRSLGQLLETEDLQIIKKHFDLKGGKHLLTPMQHKILRKVMPTPAVNNSQSLTLSYKNKDLTQASKEALLAIKDQKDLQIIYLNTPSNSFTDKRHAEEFLIDVLEVFKEQNLLTHASVAGKKRPCMTCSGRMLAFNLQCQAVNTLQFSKYPGFLWLSAFKAQNLAIQHATLEYFLSKVSNVTLDRDKLAHTDYSSETDEEDDTPSIKRFK